MSSDTSFQEYAPPTGDASEEPRLSDGALAEQQVGIDKLFDRDHLKNEWIAPSGPTVLGELMDTSFPLRLVLPSDPELLAAWPGPGVDLLLEREERDRKRQSRDLSARLSDGRDLVNGGEVGHSRSASRASIGSRGAMEWRLRSRTVRTVTPQIIHTLDGGVRKSGRDVPRSADFEMLVRSDRRRNGPRDNHDGSRSSGDGSDGDEDDGGEITQVLMRPLEVQVLQPPSTFTKRPNRFSRIPRESSGADTITPSTLDLRDRESSGTPEPQRVPRMSEPTLVFGDSSGNIDFDQQYTL